MSETEKPSSAQAPPVLQAPTQAAAASKTKKAKKKKKEARSAEPMPDTSKMKRRGGRANLKSSTATEKDKAEEKKDDEHVLDLIDLIIMKREKKISIPIPSGDIIPGHRIRKCYLSEKDIIHLIHEIKGTKYGPPCRPELTVLVVGKGGRYSSSLSASTLAAANESLAAPTAFPGVEVIMETTKELFVLSDRIEDKLITLCRCDPVAITQISSALSRCGTESTDFYDIPLLRVWRRFLNLHIIPAALHPIRNIVLTARIKRFEDLEISEYGSILGGEFL